MGDKTTRDTLSSLLSYKGSVSGLKGLLTEGTVRAADNYYNAVSTDDVVYVRVAADAYDSPAVSTWTLQSGTTSFFVTLVTNGAGRTVAASDTPSFDGLVGIDDSASNS